MIRTLRTALLYLLSVILISLAASCAPFFSKEEGQQAKSKIRQAHSEGLLTDDEASTGLGAVDSLMRSYSGKELLHDALLIGLGLAGIKVGNWRRRRKEKVSDPDPNLLEAIMTKIELRQAKQNTESAPPPNPMPSPISQSAIKSLQGRSSNPDLNPPPLQ